MANQRAQRHRYLHFPNQSNGRQRKYISPNVEWYRISESSIYDSIIKIPRSASCLALLFLLRLEQDLRGYTQAPGTQARKATVAIDSQNDREMAPAS